MNLVLNRAKSAALLIGASIALTACGGGDGGSESSKTASEDVISSGFSVSDKVADERAKAIVKNMTMEQKIKLVHGQGQPNWANTYLFQNYPVPTGAIKEAVGYIPGIPELGIPENNMIDVSSGVNAPGLKATAFPATVGLAASWDTQLAHDFGYRVGLESRDLGFMTALGGGINLVRDPRNGRGFEYMGEDPILAGELGAERTIGVQSNKMISTIKHFAFNGTETDRFISNSVVDEQTMRETELLAFEIAITKGKPGYVMCAYNLVNSVYACENPYLLNDVLKKEWGFKGMVVSDWGAQSSTIAAANNGLDEEQPGQIAEDTEIPTDMKVFFGGPWFIKNLSDAVANGDVPISRLDDMVVRKLRTMIAVGAMDNPPTRGAINEAAGNADALRFAERSIVLLKNEPPMVDGDITPVLPLSNKNIRKIVVIGSHADKGTLSGSGSGGAAPLIENAEQGCGSSLASWYPDCPMFLGSAPLQAIKDKFPHAEVTYQTGENAEEAAVAAENADVAIVFAASWNVEGKDWPDMNLPSPLTDKTGVFNYDQDALISTVAARAKRSVVVLEIGQAVKMPWLSDVNAVFSAWYPGAKGGEAIANILSGDVNPSGKLPVTFPMSEEDLVMPNLPFSIGNFMGIGIAPKYIAEEMRNVIDGIFGTGSYDKFRTVPYDEKLMLGYKWFDDQGIKPLFPFGYGLSYTKFEYSDISSSLNGDGNVDVSFTIKNVGEKRGREIAQVYATLPDNVPGNKQPPKKLVGWSNVELNSGESKTVTVSIPRKYISVWDANNTKQWYLTPGEYKFSAMNSSSPDAENKLDTSVYISRQS